MSIENWLIREDLEGGVTRLVLNRPPVNALNSDFLDLLGAHLDRLQADTAVKAVILASNSKVLSAGMDLKEALGFDLKDQQAMVRSLNVNFTKLFGFPKPTIVAASGAAIAGGFFLVLASDYRIASLKARFGLAEVRVGANFPVGPLAIARATLAPNDLRRLMLGGHPIGAGRGGRRGGRWRRRGCGWWGYWCRWKQRGKQRRYPPSDHSSSIPQPSRENR